MTTTTVDVFAQAGYSVTTTMVDRVDNQGEPCEVCQEEPRYVDATVYGVVLGVNASLCQALDCCVYCIPAVIATMDPTVDVLVELGDSLPKWTPPVVHPSLTDYLHGDVDDRMHSQDCRCVHPDAR